MAWFLSVVRFPNRSEIMDDGSYWKVRKYFVELYILNTPMLEFKWKDAVAGAIPRQRVFAT